MVRPPISPTLSSSDGSADQPSPEGDVDQPAGEVAGVGGAQGGVDGGGEPLAVDHQRRVVDRRPRRPHLGGDALTARVAAQACQQPDVVPLPREPDRDTAVRALAFLRIAAGFHLSGPPVDREARQRRAAEQWLRYLAGMRG